MLSMGCSFITPTPGRSTLQCQINLHYCDNCNMLYDNFYFQLLLVQYDPRGQSEVSIVTIGNAPKKAGILASNWDLCKST